MKKFMALYMAPTEEFDKWMKASPEEQKAGMDGWTKWMKDNAKSFVDDGAPLGKSKRVTSDDASDVRNEIGGYSIVQADSLEDAARIFKDSPHLQMSKAWVEIIECVPMPSM